jgi:hypothetical protein
MAIPRDATHPAFEAAQIAHAVAKVLERLADTIANDPNMAAGQDASKFIREEIDEMIASAHEEERAMAHRHFLYLIGEGE